MVIKSYHSGVDQSSQSIVCLSATTLKPCVLGFYHQAEVTYVYWNPVSKC